MAKKSMVEREKKRLFLVHRFFQKRLHLKNELAKGRNTGVPVSFKDQLRISSKIQKLPRNSSPIRVHNRCFVTGRPKGFFRDFGISRHVFREMAHQCLLPGVRKSSW
jgi:small subunit ribosomal protein S14